MYSITAVSFSEDIFIVYADTVQNIFEDISAAGYSRYISVCFGFFGVSNLYRNNRNKQICFETNRYNPKFSLKHQNMLAIKLFRLVFCLFRFNRNIETLCFGIEAKQPKETVSKQTKKTKKPEKYQNFKT
jgi:hypothetical protein